jgi:hypothetical protein
MQKKTTVKRKPMVKKNPVVLEENWTTLEIQPVPSTRDLVQELIDEVKGGGSVGLDRVLKLKKDLGV